MKGYFSHLSRSTGLKFGNAARSSPASSPPVNESRRSSEGVAPLHVESVRFIPSAEPATANGSVEAVVGSDARVVSTGEARDSSVAQRSLTPGHEAIVRLPNETASVELGKAYPQSTFEESEVISTTHSLTEASSREFLAEEPSLARQPTIEFSEMSLPEMNQESVLPRSDPSVLISSEEFVVRADAITSQEPRESKHKSLAHPQPSFEFSESSFAQASDPMRYLESVAEVEADLETLADRTAQAKPVNHFEIEGQPLQAVNVVADSPSAEDQPDREAIVRNYLKDVRAWVAASPAIEESSGPASERDTGLDVWTTTTAKQRDVFSLEYEAVEPQIQDLSLSIGNISIVVEEPGTDAAPPAPAPPPVERSHQRAESEPTRLSRYYLRPW